MHELVAEQEPCALISKKYCRPAIVSDAETQYGVVISKADYKNYVHTTYMRFRFRFGIGGPSDRGLSSRGIGLLLLPGGRGLGGSFIPV